jgi:hypothetical protein
VQLSPLRKPVPLSPADYPAELPSSEKGIIPVVSPLAEKLCDDDDAAADDDDDDG